MYSIHFVNFSNQIDQEMCTFTLSFVLKGRSKLLNVASFCVLSWFCLLQIVSNPKPYQTCSSYRFFVGSTHWERTLARDALVG